MVVAQEQANKNEAPSWRSRSFQEIERQGPSAPTVCAFHVKSCCAVLDIKGYRHDTPRQKDKSNKPLAEIIVLDEWRDCSTQGKLRARFSSWISISQLSSMIS